MVAVLNVREWQQYKTAYAPGGNTSAENGLILNISRSKKLVK